MTDPWQVLGLTPEADEQQVRSRYLQLVRVHTPEQAPQRFAEIQQAYEQVRDPATRVQAELFRPGEQCGTIDDLIRDHARGMVRDRLPTSTLLALADAPDATEG